MTALSAVTTLKIHVGNLKCAKGDDCEKLSFLFLFLITTED